MEQYDLDKAHKYSSNHRHELEKDNICGCFFCLKIYNPKTGRSDKTVDLETYLKKDQYFEDTKDFNKTNKKNFNFPKKKN